VQAWARDPDLHGQKSKSRSIESKESAKWLRSYEATVAVQAACPQTMVVSVGDREADIYELFTLARSKPHGPKLLIRAEHNRLVADGNARLWDHMQVQSVADVRVVDVPRTKSNRARRATLAIRYSAVTLSPPEKKKPLGEIRVWAVLASEIDPPAGESPLEWMLLTTVEVSTAAEACEKLDWYAKRWGIEVYHQEPGRPRALHGRIRKRTGTRSRAGEARPPNLYCKRAHRGTANRRKRSAAGRSTRSQSTP